MGKNDDTVYWRRDTKSCVHFKAGHYAVIVKRVT